MASLYKPTIVTYRLPDGSYRTPDGRRVTSTTPGAVRTVERSKKWYGRYADGNGKTVKVPLSESKEVARKMLAKVAGDAQMASVGIVDPFADHRGRRLAEHVEDYARFLDGKGDCAKHVRQTRRSVADVIEGCRFRTADDLQASPVIEFLARLRDGGRQRVELPAGQKAFTKAEMVALLDIHPGSVGRMLNCAGLTGEGNGKARRFPREVVDALQDRLCRGAGVRTCNFYLTAMKGFSRWLARDRRIAADPLGHPCNQNADVDVRRPRRALRHEAFAEFIRATAEGEPFRGLTGPDRLVLYTLAANTGFRAGELASLTGESFDFNATPPTVTVAAGYSKRRRKDVQPLRADVAALMKSYLAGKPKGETVWPGTWHDRAAEMLRGDLDAAGIPYQDAAGRYFDFHAMRGQFISLLAAQGVHPKVAQALARHSTITLTMDYYTHLDVLDVTGALDKLPALPSQADAEAAPAEKGRRPA
jgi:integrase